MLTIPFRSAGNEKRKRRIWKLVMLLSGAIALLSYRYLFGVGPVPGTILDNRYFRGWIVVHATGAATALLIGPLQFLSALRQRHPRIHRINGRVYVAACVIGGLSGIALAFGTVAGPAAGTGFIGLGIAWLMTTLLGVYNIVHGRVAPHREWMVRSFALTFSAVTLRLYLPLSAIMKIDYASAYPVIAWACWIPNVLLAE